MNRAVILCAAIALGVSNGCARGGTGPGATQGSQDIGVPSPSSSAVAEGAETTSSPTEDAIIPVQTEPETIDNLNLTITGLELSDWTGVHIRFENTNDYPVDCGYSASLVADGQQYDSGFGDFSGDIASKATLESLYYWDEVQLPPGVKSVRLIAKCWDDNLGRYGDSLDFDVEATT
jgi:hypothetical protein